MREVFNKNMEEKWARTLACRAPHLIGPREEVTLFILSSNSRLEKKKVRSSFIHYYKLDGESSYRSLLKLSFCLNLPYYLILLFAIWQLQTTTSLPLRLKNLFNWAVLSTLLRHCHIFEKVLSVNRNNENNLKATLKLPLAKVIFN